MKQRNIQTFIVLFTVCALVGVGASAFADKGYGRGGAGMENTPGGGPGGQQGRGPGPSANLSAEDIEKLQAQRNAFRDATAELRQQMDQKRLALRYELAKSEPDTGLLKDIQAELSGLEAQFDQKRLEHMVEMRKLNPNADGGMMGYGPGQGRGWKHGSGGGMMGYGGPRGQMGYGPGSCWNR